MALSFPVEIDLGRILPQGSRLTRDVFPNLAMAVEHITAQAHADWIAYAMGRPLPGGLVIQNRNGEYARSILMRSTGDFSGEAYSELSYAQAIEEGSPERDMKTMLNTSMKVRLSKNGRRYLIIPFRHNAPGSVQGQGMPQAVHEWWKGDRQPSHVTGRYQRASGTGTFDIQTRKRVMVPGWRYHWGSRLGASHLEAMGITGQAARHLEGMVNFRNPGGKAGGGGKKGSHSQFLTFRVMIEGSRGWIARAQPPKPAARTVADTIRPIAEAAFAAAITADIEGMLAGG